MKKWLIAGAIASIVVATAAATCFIIKKGEHGCCGCTDDCGCEE